MCWVMPVETEWLAVLAMNDTVIQLTVTVSRNSHALIGQEPWSSIKLSIIKMA